MKCKCGKQAEVQQPNIFGEIDELCRDCFNALGEPIEEPKHEDEGLFDAIWMRGLAE